VHVRYCSGDCHVGMTTQEDRLRTATQVGQKNAKSVIDWIQKQQINGGLQSPLDLLVIGGASAGSIGAQLWAYNVTRALKAKSVSLLFDSYVGVLDYESELFKSFGTCPFLPTRELQDLCENKALRLEDVTLAQLKLLPSASVATIFSKEDQVQISYYDALQIFRPIDDDLQDDDDTVVGLMTPSRFYAEAQRILQLYSGADRPAGDMANFIVSGDRHTYLPKSYLYDTAVLNGPTLANNLVLLTDWLADLIMPGKAACETCFGLRINLPASDSLQGTHYCDHLLNSHCAAMPALAAPLH